MKFAIFNDVNIGSHYLITVYDSAKIVQCLCQLFHQSYFTSGVLLLSFRLLINQTPTKDALIHC